MPVAIEMSSPITGFFGAGIGSVVAVYGIAYFIVKDERLTERILRDTVSLLFLEHRRHLFHSQRAVRHCGFTIRTAWVCGIDARSSIFLKREGKKKREEKHWKNTNCGSNIVLSADMRGVDGVTGYRTRVPVFDSPYCVQGDAASIKSERY